MRIKLPSPIDRPFFGAVQNMRESLLHYLPAVAWLDFDAGTGATHMNLPSDLFILTVRQRDAAAASTHAGAGLDAVITPPRTTPRSYHTTGRSELAVASLTPLGMLNAFRVPLAGLTDVRIPLALLCGVEEERRLQRALELAADSRERIEAFARWLEARIFQRHSLPTQQARVAQAALVLGAERSRAVDLNALAGSLSVTRRQLERDFDHALGVAPSTYRRLVRFQQAAAAVAAGQPILRVALEHGYADQAHMTRVFRGFASLTPRALALDGARAGRDLIRAGLAGRVFLLDMQEGDAPAPASLDAPDEA
jgi:AraC-like DNA-binding protein